jgi:sulfite dehydrogenase (cytochrome) subunit B
MCMIPILVVATLITLPVRAEEKAIALKKAPGVDKVKSNCAACHSLDYIQMNSPFPNAAAWDATVTKMIRRSVRRLMTFMPRPLRTI